MKRRDFLKKAFGASIGAIALPSAVKAKSAKPEVGVWQGIRFHTTNSSKPTASISPLQGREDKSCPPYIKCGERGCCLECEKKDDCWTYKVDRIILDVFNDEATLREEACKKFADGIYPALFI